MSLFTIYNQQRDHKIQGIVVLLKFVLISWYLLNCVAFVQPYSEEWKKDVSCSRHGNLLPNVVLFQSPCSDDTRGKKSGRKIIKQEPDSGDTLHETDVISRFESAIQESLAKNTFTTLILHGASKGKGRIYDRENQNLIGLFKTISGRLISLTKKRKEEVYLQITIKFHGKTDIAKNYKVRDILGRESLLQQLNAALPQQHPALETTIQRSELCTTAGTWTLQSIAKSSTIPKKLQHKLTFKKQPSTQTVQDGGTMPLSPQPHDRNKNVPLDPTKTHFFQKLGILHSQTGKPRPGMSSKYRQCQKFVEIVSHLLPSSDGASLPAFSPLKVVDMGCGKGYLTFALHSFLSQKLSNVTSIGIEMRPELVQQTNAIASELGEDFDSLHFVQGTIETFLDSNRKNEYDKANDEALFDHVDILIALHACDTATDDALHFAIEKKIPMIVTAPCCHKELRPQLDLYLSSQRPSSSLQHPLEDVLRHGIYRERISEYVTDSLRAILLEIAGYQVKIFEFVSGEHTSKNIMLTAVRRREASISAKDLNALRRRLVALSSLHGIKKQRLAYWLGESLGGDGQSDERNGGSLLQKTKPDTSISRGMPPIELP